jgi:cell division protein FtsI/penicillin-binding protein 2
VALIDRRIGWIFMAFLALLAIALTRATYLGAIKAASLQQAAVSQQITQDVIPAARGTITDRNGVELAISESADDVIADPFLIKKPMPAAQALAPLLGKPVLKLYALLTKPRDGYVPLAHLLPADQATKIVKLQIDGITTIPRVMRAYPRGWAASQVLGGVHLDGSGASGLE